MSSVRRARPSGVRASRRAVRLPAITSGSTAGSSQAGGSTRSTSAPSAASACVQAGPAMTHVRSSTRIPASGASALGRQPEDPTTAPPSWRAMSGSAATARPASVAAHSPRSAGRRPPPAATTASSRASASHPAIARVSAATSASGAQPVTDSSAARCRGALAWVRIHEPSRVGNEPESGSHGEGSAHPSVPRAARTTPRRARGGRRPRGDRPGRWPRRARPPRRRAGRARSRRGP